MALFPFFSRTTRYTKAAERFRPLVTAAGALESELKALSDQELKQRVRQYQGRSESEIHDRRVEIFAAIREASARVLNMRHFDVQLLGGLALLDGAIAEMKTGEGKTLVATLPLILRALRGRGAHLVTVNDYLARRDAEWMGPLYQFFDLTVGVSVPGMAPAEKRAAYAADITYGTNNEFGFDYLRDNMAQSLSDMVQRDLYYVIVDEVDSILIDEARTPLIISAPDAESTELYVQFSRLVPKLKEDTHYNLDEKRRAATLTDEGVSRVEELLHIDNIYEEGGIRFVHHLEQALRAQTLYRRDKDYVVRDGQVVIVDEFTGRLMEGRRYSEGLHQALEAKEGARVQQESRTLATITFQNFFRLYETLAGMTGTAITSAEEFEKVYNRDVVTIPTNKEMVRVDKPDRIFINETAKFAAVAAEIKERHAKGQPVLVGTIAIEKSEHLSALLGREGIPHEVLNAKHHAREAEIVSKAGQAGAVTISTNMAGRGTDIKLGEGVAARGGLFILGTERHEARRIDNQLRGRSGRQGDPGETQFFVSLEDDVMRIFGGERIRRLMQRLNVPPDEPIENRLVSKALEGAQERVEGYYFDMRKQVLSYDDVLNRQRFAIYALRRGVLTGHWNEETGSEKDLAAYITELAQEQAHLLVTLHTGEQKPEAWDSKELAEGIAALTGLAASDLNEAVQEGLQKTAHEGPEAVREAIGALLSAKLEERVRERATELSPEVWQRLLAAAALRAIDVHWMEHLDTMDYLRTGIGLRGYGQRDPLVEYQKESYQLFQRLLATIKSSFLETAMRAQPSFSLREGADVPTAGEARLSGGKEGSALHDLAHGAPDGPLPAAGAAVVAASPGSPLKNPYKEVGRNDPCPCGAINPTTGKIYKYKQCGLIKASHHRG